MPNLTLAPASATVAVPGAGLHVGGNSNGTNGAAWTFTGGVAGVNCNISNAALKSGLSKHSRLYAFLDTTFASQDDINATWAALGGIVSMQGGYDFFFAAALFPGKPEATMVPTSGTGKGAIRIAISQTVGA